MLWHFWYETMSCHLNRYHIMHEATEIGASKATIVTRNPRSATFVDGTYDSGSHAGARSDLFKVDILRQFLPSRWNYDIYIYIHMYIVNFHLSHWYCFASRFKQQHARTCGLKKCWNHMPQVENCNHLTSLCIVVSSIPNRTFVSSNQIGRWKLPSRWGFDSFMARRSELLGKSFFLFRWMAISSRISRFGRGAWY